MDFSDSGCLSNVINVLEMWPLLCGIIWCGGWNDKTVVFVTDGDITADEMLVHEKEIVNAKKMGETREENNRECA